MCLVMFTHLKVLIRVSIVVLHHSFYLQYKSEVVILQRFLFHVLHKIKQMCLQRQHIEVTGASGLRSIAFVFGIT